MDLTRGKVVGQSLLVAVVTSGCNDEGEIDFAALVGKDDDYGLGPALFFKGSGRSSGSDDVVLNEDDQQSVQQCCCSCVTWTLTSNGRCPVQSKWVRLHVDALLLSALVYELFRRRRPSKAFRQNLVNNFTSKYEALLFQCPDNVDGEEKHLMVKVFVDWNGQIGVIDTLWNDKLERLFYETAELENCMAWLSTLGGAYSSLGDQFNECAQIAGTLSLRQYRLAEKLGDTVAIFKCKLYLALSLMQLGDLRRSKWLIRQQYYLASSMSDVRRDRRLINMCKGAWAKLKYFHSERVRRRIMQSTNVRNIENDRCEYREKITCK